MILSPVESYIDENSDSDLGGKKGIETIFPAIYHKSD